MNLNTIDSYASSILIERLRHVTMLENKNVEIYKNCFISIEVIDPNVLIPTQRYILIDELKTKIELEYALNKNMCSMFELCGYITYTVSDKDNVYTLLPPIIEEQIDLRGRVLPVINDGMHRVYLSKKLNKNKIFVVYIRGISKKYPYYAYPLEHGWNDVSEINELQQGYIKKFHVIENNKRFYRNFDSVFTNCSKPRGANG